jgi:hypothetical protein
MNDEIVVQLPLLPDAVFCCAESGKQALSHTSKNLHMHWQHPDKLPDCITQSPTILRILDLIGPLDWGHLPERDLKHDWGRATVPNAALIAAELIKLNENLPSLKHLHRFLDEHSGFISLLGFAPLPNPDFGLSFSTPAGSAHLPTQRHLARMLRNIPNTTLQFLLADSVRLIHEELTQRGIAWGECVSLDTKHIIAFVQQNNPKAYVSERFNKHKQPAGDPDCRLGCKRRHNKQAAPPTPTRKPVPASVVSVGEFYWGYGSGIVVTKVPELGEFVLAEFTQPFDHGDLTYFFPLMAQTQQRLGRKPKFGTFDAAFDAWYVYDYFATATCESPPAGGFAAVPFSEKGGKAVTGRQFSPDGLPICKAGLPMPLKFAFTDRTSCLVEHERGKYVCPLLFPARSANACPVHHKLWKKGGCTAQMPTSIGARLRYTLDRDSDPYKLIYNQRTAVERINSQSTALGIERPNLRNGAAIANQNTLIYLLINLRFLHRLRHPNQPPSY